MLSLEPLPRLSKSSGCPTSIYSAERVGGDVEVPPGSGSKSTGVGLDFRNPGAERRSYQELQPLFNPPTTKCLSAAHTRRKVSQCMLLCLPHRGSLVLRSALPSRLPGSRGFGCFRFGTRAHSHLLPGFTAGEVGSCNTPVFISGPEYSVTPGDAAPRLDDLGTVSVGNPHFSLDSVGLQICLSTTHRCHPISLPFW